VPLKVLAAILREKRGKIMEAVLTIPDDVAVAIRNGSNDPLARRLLELAAIQAYEVDLIGERDVMDMLGLDDREELYAFFKRYDVRSNYTTEEQQSDVAALDALLKKHGR
jgi:hypothetical protein